MRPPINQDEGDLLVKSDWVAGVAVSENVVAVTHILGRRRLVCCNFIAEILFHDLQSPTTIDQIARQRNAPAELIRTAVEILYAALLIKKVGTDEAAAIRSGLDTGFAEPRPPRRTEPESGSYPEWLVLESLDDSAGTTSGTAKSPLQRPIAVDPDTPLQLSSAVTAMRFGDESRGVITHFLEGPLLVEIDLLKLAMAFRNRTTVRDAIESAGLQHRDIDRVVLGCQFLIRRNILCSSLDEDIEKIRRRIRPQIDLVHERFTASKDVTPAGFQDPHFLWYQPYGACAIETIEPVRASGRVAILGQCQSHFMAGALEFLAQREGWHLETHGWFDVVDELETQDWSLIILPTVVEAAAFYEAFAAGDVDGCNTLVPEVVAQVDRSLCRIREKTDAPVLVISVGEPTLHGHGVTSSTRHGLKRAAAELNSRLAESTTSFEHVRLLDETGVLAQFPDVVTLDDEYNAAPHHCGFDIWSWRDHPFEATNTEGPERSEAQIHPALPLARACLEHLRDLYLAPRAKLIVFEPNGMLWPGEISEETRPYPNGINVYTGLNDFVYVGIHEALCALRQRGIRLACLSSSSADLVQQGLRYESEARNLVRTNDLVCVLGGEDKEAMLDQALAITGAREDEVLWIDQAYVPSGSFRGHHYAGAIWELRRYLLTTPLLDSGSATRGERPTEAIEESSEASAVPDRIEGRRTLDSILMQILDCPESALQSTDDLELLGLDSFGCAGLLLEIEARLQCKLADHDHVGSVLFSRQALHGAVMRALESRSTGMPASATGPGEWFESFTRERWLEQDIGSIISRHHERPGTGWIFKFVRSAKPFDYQYVTWNDLYGQALGYTRRFRQEGLQPGETITILLPQGLSLIAAVLGAILGGMVPSVSAFPGERLTSSAFLEWFGELAQKSHTRCVVVAEDLRDLIAGELEAKQLDMPVVSTVPAAVFDEPAFAASPDSTALLQHSSGTTGIKKGVSITHRALLAQIRDLSRELDCNDKDVIVSWLPYYHDMGLIACLMLPLLRSIPTVVMSPFDWVRQPHMLLRQISEERGTLCWLPNFAFQHCANRIQTGQLAGLDLSSMRAAINCSEPVTDDAMVAFFERFKAFGMRFSALSASYAMAENTFAVTQARPGRPPKTIAASASTFAREQKVRKLAASGNGDVARFVSSGSALPGTRIRIVAGDTILAEGEVGEIQVQGDYLFDGYHNDADGTRDAFDDNWYRTGDLGFLLDGELYVTGRKKDLIIISGQNVYPHDVESEIGAFAEVRPGRCVAFGVYDEGDGTEKLVVMAELDADAAGTEADDDALKAAMRDRVLSRFFVNIADIRLFRTEQLRKSTSGKLARGANRELYHSLR
jgi:acyl-CoA synthetase (AMP-forming)/AMP-acid ligase II